MLTLRFSSDAEGITGLYRALGFEREREGVHFLFYDEDRAVGFWRMRFEGDVAVTDAIRFDGGVTLPDRDFFVRAMLFKLGLGADVMLRICGVHKELARFGFEERGGNMEISTKAIVLDAHCKG